VGGNGAEPQPRVVIVHDFMETFGGAERVTAELARAFPKAPVVAILGRREVAARMGVAGRFTSLLPARPALLRKYRLLAPLYPVLAASRALPETDVVVSSSYAFAHGFRSTNDAPRLCYSWGPLRFAWSMTEQYRDHWTRSAAGRWAFEAVAAWMRAADRRAVRGVDRFVAPLDSIAARIRDSYGIAASTLGPPVDCERFSPSEDPPGDYYLLCGRLIEPYKRVTALVDAFNRLSERLVIAGDGPARPRLERIAGPGIEFLGHLEDDELVAVMRGCRAAVLPSREDFGLSLVEMMACGRPVLAFAGGGATETVVPGVTGELFTEQTADAIERAVLDFDPGRYDPGTIREHALNWERGRFRERIRQFVGELADGDGAVA
jgi:glycosyltransferase involved in cell wall biosynthesis